jgi:hypothetical protein
MNHEWDEEGAEEHLSARVEDVDAADRDETTNKTADELIEEYSWQQTNCRNHRK